MELVDLLALAGVEFMERGSVFWLMGRNQESERFRVNGMGLREEMPPLIVDRPRGTGDWLLMHFHDPVRLRVGGSLRLVSADSLMIWGPEEGHFYGDPSGMWSHTWIHCAGVAVGEALVSAGLKRGLFSVPGGACHAEEAVESMYRELSLYRPANGVILLNLFANYLLRSRREAGMEGLGVTKLPRHLFLVKRLMESRCVERLTLRELARAACRSVSRFSEEFKDHFGTSPGKYLIRLRMERACYLLGDRSLTVREVGERVGYPDPFHFAKMFKRHVGASPGNWRKNR